MFMMIRDKMCVLICVLIIFIIGVQIGIVRGRELEAAKLDSAWQGGYQAGDVAGFNACQEQF